MAEHYTNTPISNTCDINSNDSDMYHIINGTKSNDNVKSLMEMFYKTILITIIVFGTIGNLLTFIVMQRGSLKNSSTCFYMAMLALSDTGKCEMLRIMKFKCSDYFYSNSHSFPFKRLSK